MFIREKSNRLRYNVGQFGRITQVSLYARENDEAGIHPAARKKGDEDMAYQPKPSSKAPKTPARKEYPKQHIENPEELDAWMNKAGNALLIKIEGTTYVTSLDNVQDLLGDKKKGIKLGVFVDD